MKQGFRLASASAVAIVFGLYSGAADAQSAADASAQNASTEGGLADIVVTAQKRSENLQDVPIAVTALSNQELAGANIQGQLALPKLTPNFNFTVTSSFASAYIRGVGTQFANPGLESSVSVYFDDSYIPRAASGMFAFNDIERIEVLKGPQGTLYGRNATGGAIRIITVDPKPEFEGKASVTYGTDNRFQVDGVINIPLGEGVSARFAAKHDENDGYARNLVPNSPQRKMQNRNEEIYTGKILFEPSDDLTIKLSGDYSLKDDREGNTFWNLYPGLPEQIGVGAPGGCVSTSFYNGCNDGVDQTYVKQYGGALRIDYDLGQAIISSITSYRVAEEFGRSDLDATGADIQPATGKPKTKQFTEELQIASDGTGPLKYVAGLYYLWEKSEYDLGISGSAFAGFGPLFPQFNRIAVAGYGRIRAKSFAPYAQLDYELSDQFTVTVGARYTRESKKLLFSYGRIGEDNGFAFPDPATAIRAPFGRCQTEPPVNPGDPPLNTFLCEADQQTAKFNKFTPKLTLSYKPNDDLLLYATVSRGFKSGGFNLPAFGAVDAVAPETLDNLEAGWKFQQGNIRFNGSVFHYDYKDLQIQITDQTTGGTRVKNAAAAKIWGIEADFTWAASDQFEFGAGGGYLDTQYKNFRGDAYLPCGQVAGLPAPDAQSQLGKAAALAACAGQGGLGLALAGGQELSGNRLVNAPKFSGYVRGTFTQPLDGMGKIQLSSILNYRTTAYFDPANRFADKKRALLSARVQWTSENERFYLAVYGENLTDKKYDVTRVPQASGGWRTPAAPRQIYVTAGINF